MGDRRTVATDALETLGMTLEPGAARDAIHLAVEPVIAGQTLKPGDDIGIINGVAVACDNPVGIVDPFLCGKVKKGQRFWLIVYPRQITSLRHVWTHPAFPPVEIEKEVTASLGRSKKEASEAWLRNFCQINDCPSYECVIAEASDPGESWSDEYLHFDGQDAHGEIPDEFWDHVEIVTGKNIEKRAKYFSCSC